CSPGSYTVTVTNPVNGCTNTATAIVTENTVGPLVTIANPAPITCATPTVTLTASSTGNMTYSWSGSCFTSSTQIANPQVCEPGVYTVVVTNPTNGCTSSSNVTVQSDVVIPTAVVASPERLNCNNVTVQLNGTGSSAGAQYTYQWSTIGGNIVSGSSALIATADEDGPYRFVVTNNANGCTSEVLVNVVQTDPVTAVATASPASCAGASSGSAAVAPDGGTAPYTFLWSNGSTNSIATGLAAGTYTVIVTDADGCTAAAATTVTEPTALQLTTTTTAQTAVNLNDGTASVSASGGTPGYTYAWVTGSTTAALSNLSPGTITVTVTDANGCTATQIANVNSYNCNLNATISSTAASCSNSADGSATVAVSGATEPVAYVWSNSAATATANGLSAGTYSVSVTDFAGCPLVLSTTVQAPAPIVVNIAATQETVVGASDGTALAQATGGTAPYTYLWNTSATTASIEQLTSGTYTVTVMDANGCSSVQTATLQSIVCDLTTELIVTPVKCFNTSSGTASAIVTGAVGDVTYAWSTNATTDAVENLGIGTITVTVTDAVGCTTVDEADIVGPSAPLDVQVVNITGVPCPQDQSGSVTPSISGGWGQPYTFQFSWGVGGFSGFSAGLYSFTVTDAEGCSVVAGFNIEVLDDTPPLVVCPDNMVLCGANLFDYPAPQATDNCSGTLTPTLISGLESGSIFLDGVSTQVFTATDAAGNTGSCSFDVVVYPISDIIIDSVQNDVGGASVGAIYVQVIGESGPYTYQWIRNGVVVGATEDLTGVFTGTYTLIATDINGCTVQLAPVFVDNLVGTDNPANFVSNIKLWPNPAGNSFRVEMNGFEASDMSILNAQGRLVRMVQPTEWNDAIEVSELPTGFYYLKVISQNGSCQVVKWVKGE
ncbi:MAG: T9SS type A sorting domain-containing protein, partial [Saprospiraceae bacterium]|nr:T9SS type A sorting domain-containing protein [Saprospiraceae bacterium]